MANLDPEASGADSKSIFTSKTVIFNVLSSLLTPAFIWANTKYGLNLTPEQQMAVIVGVYTVGNLVLRRFSSGSVHIIAPK